MAMMGVVLAIALATTRWEVGIPDETPRLPIVQTDCAPPGAPVNLAAFTAAGVSHGTVTTEAGEELPADLVRLKAADGTTIEIIRVQGGPIVYYDARPDDPRAQPLVNRARITPKDAQGHSMYRATSTDPCRWVQANEP